MAVRRDHEWLELPRGCLKLKPMPDPLSWLTRLRFHPADQGLACYPPGTTIGPRRVVNWQFVWLVRGSATWVVGGRDIPVQEGSVLLMRPGLRDLLRWDPVRRSLHGWITFTAEGSARPPSDLAMIRQSGPDDILLPLLRHLRCLLADHPPGWEILGAGALHQAMLTFASGSAACEREDRDDTPSLVDHALEWLARRWATGPLRSPSLMAWAKACGVTREGLIRAFRQGYGTTPMESVRLLRLDRAAQLLAQDGSVQEIASATGFANPFHFSRCFAAVYGCPPTTFRRRIISGGTHGHVRLVKVRTMASRIWHTR